MGISVTNQAYIFLCSIVGGLVVGFIFDVFRICRKVIKTTNFITYLEDILFWIIVAIIIFVFAFITNDGELRWYAFLGVLLGTIFYNLLFSAYVITVSVTVINFIKKIILLVIRILLFPFAVLYKIFRRPILVTIELIKKCFRNSTKIFNRSIERILLPFKRIKRMLKKI